MRPMKKPFDASVSISRARPSTRLLSLPLAAAASVVLLATASGARAQEADEPYVMSDGTSATSVGTSAAPRSSPTVISNFSELMSGKNIALKLRMKDLNSSFRRMTAGGQSDIFSIQMQMMSAQAGIELGVYYTRGQTVTLGGETYLIAYRPQTDLPDDLWNHMGHGETPEPLKPGPNSVLALSLLNLRTAGSLNDVRPFDPKQDISTVQETNAATLRQLQRLGQGILTFAQQRGGALPPISATMSVGARQAFYPYVHDQRLWVHPVTNEPFRGNAALSGKRLRNIRNAAQVVMFSEATPSPDGTRAVLFADGHAVRVSTDQWTRISAVKPIIKAANTAPITARVIRALLNTRGFNGSHITVSTNNDSMTVTLSGTVKNQAQKDRAPGIAYRNALDYRIINRLRITTSRSASRSAASRSAQVTGSTTTSTSQATVTVGDVLAVSSDDD